MATRFVQRLDVDVVLPAGRYTLLDEMIARAQRIAWDDLRSEGLIESGA